MALKKEINPINEKMIAFMHAIINDGTIRSSSEFYAAMDMSEQNGSRIKNPKWGRSFTPQNIRDAMSIFNGNANFIFGLEDNMYRKTSA